MSKAIAIILLVCLAYKHVNCLEQAPLFPQRDYACTEVRIRKEYRDMTATEWSDFSRALSLIDGETDRWARMHLEHVEEAHGVAAFFPWHRMFVMAWENRLRELVANVTVPYWDWTTDWSDPLSASIFKLIPVKTGSNGDCKYRRTVPNRHCLTRNYTAKDFTTFYSYNTIERVLKEAGTFEQLWRQLEPAPHGIVHAAIGGVGGDMTQMHSPNDPIFWLHHANMDRMWAKWQEANWQSRSKDYSGSGARGRKVKLTDTLAPFRVTAEDSVDYRRFCYQYQPYSGWAKLGNNNNGNQQRRNNQRMRVEAAAGLLPQPLPDHFLMMHGMNVTEVREQEGKMRELMLRDLVGNLNETFTQTTTTSDGTSDSAHLEPTISWTILCLLALFMIAL